jgi:hypothetical protein
MSSIKQCKIVAEETPKVIRNCEKCKKHTEFTCSEKFRMNAQQKNIDVWLIYKCIHCDNTWNYPVLKRVHVDCMDRKLHQQFQCNDRETAWEYAFQIDQLRKMCSKVNTDIKYTVICEEIFTENGDVTLDINYNYKFDLRLDKLMTRVLGISRSRLLQMTETGEVVTSPDVHISSKIKERLRVHIRLDQHVQSHTSST